MVVNIRPRIKIFQRMFVSLLFVLLYCFSITASAQCNKVMTGTACCYCATNERQGRCECEFVNCVTCYELGNGCDQTTPPCEGGGSRANTNKNSNLESTKHIVSINLSKNTFYELTKVYPRLAAVTADFATVFSKRGRSISRGKVSFASMPLTSQDVQDNWMLTDRLSSNSYNQIVERGKESRRSGNPDAIFLFELEKDVNPDKATLTFYVVDRGEKDPPINKLILILTKGADEDREVWEIANWDIR